MKCSRVKRGSTVPWSLMRIASQKTLEYEHRNKACSFVSREVQYTQESSLIDFDSLIFERVRILSCRARQCVSTSRGVAGGE